MANHSKACMTTFLLSGDPNCPACGDRSKKKSKKKKQRQTSKASS